MSSAPLPPLVEPVHSLSDAERARTLRHTTLPQLGEIGQRRLSGARVCVLGAGGLGAPTLLYLAAAGVATIGVIDDDRVDVSNLHRQVLHGVNDVGRLKVVSAAESIQAIAPDCVVEQHAVRLDSHNAADLLRGYDLVLDGTDNFETRYLVNDTCAELGIPLVWAAVLRFDAQISVFWADPPAGREGVELRDLFPTPPAPGEVPSCAEAGVLGALCGQVGSIMATEAIKLITGIGEPLLGRVLVIDALTARHREIPLRRAVRAGSTPAGAAAEQTTPALVPTSAPAPAAELPGTSVADLAAQLAAQEDLVVLDVREPSEHAERSIPGAILVPLGELLRGSVPLDLPTDRRIVVHCHRETRARRAAAVLRSRGHHNVSVLDGGIVAWDAAHPSLAPKG